MTAPPEHQRDRGREGHGDVRQADEGVQIGDEVEEGVGGTLHSCEDGLIRPVRDAGPNEGGEPSEDQDTQQHDRRMGGREMRFGHTCSAPRDTARTIPACA
jgi:hypothetical protein